MTDTLTSTAVEDTTPYEVYISGNEDFLIPIVFPDYDILVESETFEIFGYKISTPEMYAPLPWPRRRHFDQWRYWSHEVL